MALVDRLSKLDAPDREVDREIHAHFGLPFSEVLCDKPFIYNAYTTSVEAAIALTTRVLPGWNGDLDIGKPITDSGKMGCRIWMPESKYHNYVGEGFNSATALLIALLRAKETNKP